MEEINLTENCIHINPTVKSYIDTKIKGYDKEICRIGFSIASLDASSCYLKELRKKVVCKELDLKQWDTGGAKRAYRELTLLHALRHNNLISLFDSRYKTTKQMDSDNNDENNDECGKEVLTHLMLVTENQGRGTLHKSLNYVLSHIHVKKLAFDVLNGLNYMHKYKIIHGDFKSDNIILGKDWRYKIIDYGVSRSVKFDTKMTPIEGHLSYKAPEQMFRLKSVDEKIDMWAFGCVLAELFIQGKYLFDATGGKTLEQHWGNITDLLGAVNLEECFKLEDIGLKDILVINAKMSDKARTFEAKFNDELLLVPHHVRKTRSSARKDYATQLRDLLAHLIVYNPGHRFSARQAIEHAYLDLPDICPVDEIVEPRENEFYDFDQEKGVNSVEEWKDKIMAKIFEIKSDFDNEHERKKKKYNAEINGITGLMKRGIRFYNSHLK